MLKSVDCLENVKKTTITNWMGGGSNMLHIVFEYRDEFTNGKWHKQECTCSSVQECIDWYGLGVDCEYHILSVEEV